MNSRNNLTNAFAFPPLSLLLLDLQFCGAVYPAGGRTQCYIGSWCVSVSGDWPSLLWCKADRSYVWGSALGAVVEVLRVMEVVGIGSGRAAVGGGGCAVGDKVAREVEGCADGEARHGRRGGRRIRPSSSCAGARPRPLPLSHSRPYCPPSPPPRRPSASSYQRR